MNEFFTRVATSVSNAAGHAVAFIVCCALVLVWAASGPLFGFSDTWQLVINTGTTIVTFLMVFLIQNTQNRDGAAIQAKLDELVRASAASNQFIGIEHLTQQEIDEFRAKCEACSQARCLLPSGRTKTNGKEPNETGGLPWNKQSKM